jgi:hypothetical protein
MIMGDFWGTVRILMEAPEPEGASDPDTTPVGDSDIPGIDPTLTVDEPKSS